jgi:lipopolysaccharide biosynthesis glycosyltransferase
MLTSVLKHNSNVVVFLMTEGLTDDNLYKIREEVESKAGKFHLILVDGSIISQLPMPDLSELSHISSATYYRLLITYLLPKNIDKIIYLDCDIIVRKSLEDLWETDINNYALGAVYQIAKETVYEIQRLGYPPKYGYFNAGVLLINLDYWRKHKISDKLISYLIDNYNVIKYHDQDALNAVLYKKCLMISCKWNMMSVYFSKDIFLIKDVYNGEIINEYKTYMNQLKIEMADPTLIHFVSKPKPWDPYSVHPFRKEYYKYAKFSHSFNKIKQPKKIYSDAYYFFYKMLIINIYKNHVKGWLELI